MMRRKTVAFWVGVSWVLLGVAPSPRLPQAPQVGAQAWVCPPCGGECDQEVLESAGSCSACGMELVEESAIPSVAIVLYEGVELLSFVGPAEILSASKGARIFTVADSTDPIPTSGLGELVPMHSFSETPYPDVLIIPSGRTVLETAEDELVMSWVVPAAERAGQVLAVGTGGLLLAKGGLLEGHRMTTFPWFADYAAEQFKGVSVLSDRPLITSGKFTTARETGHALHASLHLVRQLFGEKKGRKAAEDLGLPWPPPFPVEAEK